MRRAATRGRTTLASTCWALAVVTSGDAARAQPASGSAVACVEESAAAAQDCLDTAVRLQDAFAAVAARVFPSVVCVTSYVRDEPAKAKAKSAAARPNQWREANPAGPYAGFHKLHSGSGLLLGQENHVVTLRQFVTRPTGQPAEVVDVETADGRHLLSRVVGVEPTLGLAVLEFVAVPEHYRPNYVAATLGDSDSIRVGHWTFALGDPSGPAKLFAPGVLAALPERRCYQEQLTATYLQSALRVHPEAYGGPLVNIRGEVIGITTPHPQQASDCDGIEYALPIDIVLPIYEGICANESFRSPWLGFAVLEIAALRDRMPDPEAFRTLVRPRLGVYIDDVFDPSPAARADIRVGDFLVSFNGQPIFSVYRFQEQLHLTGIGRMGKLEIFRAGQTLVKEVTVEERPEAAVPH